MRFSGDFRTDENIALAGHQTLWLREHNRLVDILRKNKPNWKPDKIFQEARRINIAQYQHIIFNEFLPLLIGWLLQSNMGCLLLTPFENPQRWMGQNTFPILLLNDDNMIGEH